MNSLRSALNQAKLLADGKDLAQISVDMLEDAAKRQSRESRLDKPVLSTSSPSLSIPDPTGTP